VYIQIELDVKQKETSVGAWKTAKTEASLELAKLKNDMKNKIILELIVATKWWRDNKSLKPTT
jgi:hypothetical protein